MPLEIPDHRHCQMCGKAIPPDQIFCSQECKEKFEQIIRKKRRLLLIMYIVILALFLVVILVNLS